MGFISSPRFSRVGPVLAGALLLLAAVPAARAQAVPRVTETGFLYSPFREDGAAFDPKTGTFGGRRGDDGCTVDAPQADRKDCLPTGATQVVLPDARVLYWNALEGSERFDGAVALQGGDLFLDEQSRVMDLDYSRAKASRWQSAGTGAFPGTPREPGLLPGPLGPGEGGQANNSSLFCSVQQILSDGRVLAAGGTNYYSEPRIADRVGVAELEGTRNARIFDPDSGRWTKAPDMHYGRWYPSMVTLANGDLFVASGVTKLIKPVYPTHPGDSGTNVIQSETYTASSPKPAWVDNGRRADRSLPLYPRLHLLPNGRVFYDAAGQAYNPLGQSYDQAVWSQAAVYDPRVKTWRSLGVPGLTAGGAITTEPGFRGSTFSQMLLLRPAKDGSYPVARFLSAGGVVGGSPGSAFPVAGARINEVRLDREGAETLETRPAGALSVPRWYGSGTVLPNGQVFVSGGADLDAVVAPGSESAIRQTELFTPDVEGGKWRLGPVLDRDRNYHNSAVLLPTGQVLIGGHAPIPNTYGPVSNNPDTPARDFANNFKDGSFQVYTPPNLSRGYARPIINGRVGPSLDYGQRLRVPTVQAAAIHSVVLVRNPSVTHLVDGDQRAVEVPIVARAPGNGVTVKLPGPGVLPPGPYMLFLNLDAAPGGDTDADEIVPSVAQQVFVGATAPAWAASAPQQSASPRRP
jgi:hypothetical protein